MDGTGAESAQAVVVWLEAWQGDCCGAPFAVGSRVTWTVWEATATDLQEIMGPERAATVQYVEEHHTQRTDLLRTVRGTVTAIEVVHCRDAPGAGGNPNAYSPVPGTATFTPVPSSTEGTASVAGGPLFQGYLVVLADVVQPGPSPSERARNWLSALRRVARPAPRS